jgi:hypothetical protein
MEFHDNVLNLEEATDDDPADKDPELKKRLEENKKVSEKKMAQVKYLICKKKNVSNFYYFRYLRNIPKRVRSKRQKST